MKGVNKVILIGNLGRDPEVRATRSGTSVANLRIATTESRKDASGEWRDQTEWHSVVLFGRTAEVAKEYLTKGSSLYVEGRLQTRSWEDKEGNKRNTTEVVGDRMVMLGGRGGGGGGGGGGDYGGRDYGSSAPQDDFAREPFHATDEDVPF